jgi:hypothetical protein
MAADRHADALHAPLTIPPARVVSLTEWLHDAEMCPASCRVVGDLLDEVLALRASVTAYQQRTWQAESTLERERAAQRAEDDAEWQRRLTANARLLGRDA